MTCRECNKTRTVCECEPLKKCAKVKVMRAEFCLHSHHEKGEPVQWDLLNISGNVSVSWLLEMFRQQDTNNAEDLEMLMGHVGVLDKPVWLEIEPIEDCDGRPWFKVVGGQVPTLESK